MTAYSLGPILPERPLHPYAREISHYFDLLDNMLVNDPHNLPFILQHALCLENAEEKVVEIDNPIVLVRLTMAATVILKGQRKPSLHRVLKAKCYIEAAKAEMHKHLIRKKHLYVPAPVTTARVPEPC